MVHAKTLALAAACLLIAAALAGCTGGNNGERGSIKQSGSSTVFPIAEAWAEALATQGLDVSVEGGGSGRGASDLCAGLVDIGDLSRHMRPEEIAKCEANGVTPQEWKVAYDGISIVVNPQNTWVDHLTVAELKKMWQAENPAQTWADVRAGWPAEKIVLYGPDSDSGTYEYFNEEVLGKKCGADGKKMCPPRSDYNPNADDNFLVEGVGNTQNALGYFGYAYYLENKDKLKVVPVKEKDESPAVTPTFDTIRDGTYKPLARPIFMYTNGVPSTGSALHAYFKYAMGDGQELVPETGYVPLDDATLSKQRALL